MKFGLSRICITARLEMNLLGHPVSLKSDGIYTNLYSRAIYLSDAKTEILIISNDLCMLPSETQAFIRAEISRHTGINPENIIVHTTHAHAGPAVSEVFNQSNADNEDQKKIIGLIIDAGAGAYKNKINGSMSSGKTALKGISFNRRYVMKNNTVETHPFKDDPNLLEAEGPDDPELNVLMFFDENNNIKGLLANFVCHLTSNHRKNTKFSADFPAHAEKNLQAYFNDSTLVMLYLNGACGNLCQYMKTDFWKKIEAHELLKLYEQYKDNNLENVPVTLARISDILLVTIPGEIFVEYGLKIKEALKNKYSNIFIGELCNAYVGYIPTPKAFKYKDSGYETRLLTSGKLAENAGEIITNEILRIEKRL